MEYTFPTPILFAVFPFLLAGFVVNGFLIWLFTKKDVPIDKSYWMGLISYSVVAVLGLFITFNHSTTANFWSLMIYFGLAFIFEWFYLVVYFQKYSYSWFRCLIISAVANVLTFGAAVYSLFWHTGLLTKYADVVKIQLQSTGIIN